MSDARFTPGAAQPRGARDAVPGSVRVEDEGEAPWSRACLRFWPIATASRYLGSVASTGPA